MALVRTLFSISLLILTPITASSETWQEAVRTRIASESKSAAAIWQKALENGVASNKGLGRDDRRIFTLIQRTVESEISKSLQNGDIKNAVMIIHSSKPSTPLLLGADGINLNKLDISPKSKEIVQQRHKILLNYLKHGGTLVSVHQQNVKLEQNIEYKEFYTLAKRYKSLIDKPVKSVPNRYWGATYLIRQLDDSIFAFSVSTKQASLAGRKVEDGHHTWNIWFGPLLNTEVSKRVVQIESFLKSEGVDIYTYLGLDSAAQ